MVLVARLRTKIAIAALVFGGSLVLTNVLAVSGGTTIDLTDRSVASGTDWTYDAGSNTYDISGNVTVIGMVTEAAETLTLDIADGATVEWAAQYASASDYDDTLVNLPGEGRLEMLQTSYIRNAGSGAAIRSTGENAELMVSGAIDSQTGGAIWADGINAAVVIDGGMVTSVGTSTVQPTIYMRNQDNNITNVTVRGTGYVAANAYGAPAIQTYGNVVVEDMATVYQVGGSGAGRGPAVNALGATSAVTVRGGQVWSESGVAIHTNGAGAEVVVSGGQVFSGTGARAIYSQNAGATVRVEGGLVFANNTVISGASGGATAVVNASNFEVVSEGVAAAWNAGAGNTTYTADTDDDLIVLPSGATARWQQDSGASGIMYSDGAGQNMGFLDIGGVTVEPVAGSIYFDVVSGGFYTDYALTIPYTGQENQWSWDGSTLSLQDFRWITSASYAMYVVNGDIRIVLSGSSEFRSEATVGATTGIISDGDIVFEGDGAVLAAGGDTDTGSTSYGILANEVEIDGGTVTVLGETMAIFNNPPSTTTVGIENYVYWEGLSMSDPGGDGVVYVEGTTDDELAYEHDLDSKYLKVEPLEEIGFSAVQVGGRPDTADSTGIELTFDEPINDITAANVVVRNGSGRVIAGDMVGAGATWTIELDEVLAQGEVTVTMGNFETYLMDTPSRAVMVYKLVEEGSGSVVTPGVPNTGVR